MREQTTGALVVAEAMHATAATDIANLVAALAESMRAAGWTVPSQARLQRSAPRFELLNEAA
ncbi:hypothetical protein J7E62_29480 [Variovorax paradoxus]|nr:hypothetical protein [Variovorax paradoxus]